MTFIGVVSGLRKHPVPHGTSTTSAGEGISVALGSGFPGPAGRPALRRTGTLGNWNTKSIFLFSIFNYYCAVVFQSWESFTSFSCTKKQCVISFKFYIGGTILYNSFSTLLFFTHHYIFDNNSC